MTKNNDGTTKDIDGQLKIMMKDLQKAVEKAAAKAAKMAKEMAAMKNAGEWTASKKYSCRGCI